MPYLLFFSLRFVISPFFFILYLLFKILQVHCFQSCFTSMWYVQNIFFKQAQLPPGSDSVQLITKITHNSLESIYLPKCDPIGYISVLVYINTPACGHRDFRLALGKRWTCLPSSSPFRIASHSIGMSRCITPFHDAYT